MGALFSFSVQDVRPLFSCEFTVEEINNARASWHESRCPILRLRVVQCLREQSLHCRLQYQAAVSTRLRPFSTSPIQSWGRVLLYVPVSNLSIRSLVFPFAAFTFLTFSRKKFHHWWPSQNSIHATQYLWVTGLVWTLVVADVCFRSASPLLSRVITSVVHFILAQPSYRWALTCSRLLIYPSSPSSGLSQCSWVFPIQFWVSIVSMRKGGKPPGSLLERTTCWDHSPVRHRFGSLPPTDQSSPVGLCSWRMAALNCQYRARAFFPLYRRALYLVFDYRHLFRAYRTAPPHRLRVLDLHFSPRARSLSFG